MYGQLLTTQHLLRPGQPYGTLTPKLSITSVAASTQNEWHVRVRHAVEPSGTGISLHSSRRSPPTPDQLVNPWKCHCLQQIPSHHDNASEGPSLRSCLASLFEHSIFDPLFHSFFKLFSFLRHSLPHVPKCCSLQNPNLIPFPRQSNARYGQEWILIGTHSNQFVDFADDTSTFLVSRD